MKRKTHRKLHKKRNTMMRLASVLLVLAFVSTCMLAGLLAKYNTSSTDGDSARVIGFGQLTLTETGDFRDDGKMVVIPGANMKKQAEVTFSGSESATYIFVEVELSEDWTLNADNATFSSIKDGVTMLQWKMDESWKYLLSENNSYVFYQELAPNVAFKDGIVANDGELIVEDEITKDSIESVKDIYIKFYVTAVQSGGFEDPTAAWKSISS